MGEKIDTDRKTKISQHVALALFSSFRFKYLKQPRYAFFSPHCDITEVLIFLWCLKPVLPGAQQQQRRRQRTGANERIPRMYAWCVLTVMCVQVNASWFLIGEYCVWGGIAFSTHAVIWFQGVLAALWPAACLFVGGYACCHAVSVPLRHVLLSVGVMDVRQAANVI